MQRSAHDAKVAVTIVFSVLATFSTRNGIKRWAFAPGARKTFRFFVKVFFFSLPLMSLSLFFPSFIPLPEATSPPLPHDDDLRRSLHLSLLAPSWNLEEESLSVCPKKGGSDKKKQIGNGTKEREGDDQLFFTGLSFPCSTCWRLSFFWEGRRKDQPIKEFLGSLSRPASSPPTCLCVVSELLFSCSVGKCFCCSRRGKQ